MSKFVKGDPRINRKGRPKNFDKLRALALEVANENMPGTAWSRIEVILRNWSSSEDANLQKAFVEVAYGKVPNKVEVTGRDGRPIEHRDVTELSDEELEAIASGGSSGTAEPEEGET